LPFPKYLLLYQVFKEEKVLKRYQVLLPDWLGEYVEYLVNTYDLSFSEMIRAEICYSILAGIGSIYPDYKLSITAQEISKLAKNNIHPKVNKAEMHRILSKMYFETRKVVEFRLAKEGKKKK
jgi:hypothetical protein